MIYYKLIRFNSFKTEGATARTLEANKGLSVAWEQVLDASEWSEHSTRRDESHKYRGFGFFASSVS